MITFLAHFMHTPSKEYAFNTEDEVELDDRIKTTFNNATMVVSKVIPDSTYKFISIKTKKLSEIQDSNSFIEIRTVNILHRESV